MRTFEKKNVELNEMVDFIRETINIPRNGRNYNDFKVCVEYHDHAINLYPTEGDNIFLADKIARKAIELNLDLYVRVGYKHEEHVPIIRIY